MRQELHAQKLVRDHYAGRRLETELPGLKTYLFPKARVLDVGCGPGSITLDVAEAVHPGEVYGVDPVEESIEQANGMKAEREVGNITFQVGEAYSLDFADDAFDLVYSRSTFGYFPDPERALTEMRRVTRKEGWIVITLGDEDASVMYPPCPTFEKVLSIRRKHWTDPTDPNHYYDPDMGRRAVELLKKAGFEKFQIEHQGGGISYAVDEPINIEYDLAWLNYYGGWDSFYNKLYSMRVLEEETVIAAQNELKNWANGPYSLRISAGGLIVAGEA